MNFDFALLLVIATAVTGVIWGIDALLFAPRRRARIADAEAQATGDEGEAVMTSAVKEPVLVEYARSFFPVILVVLLLRSFVVEPFRIPSGSMLPTLLIGDFILVNKFTYGLRLPVLDTKIVPLGEPHRGDVIVFRYPEDPSVDYIKRVIGVPGDVIAYRNKVLYVNGKQAVQDVLGVYQDSYQSQVDLRVEQLGPVKHDILINRDAPAVDFTVKVPPHSYFAMGDNRDNSRDSRYWGFVPERNLVGRAFLVWMNWHAWNRIGDVIK